MITVRFAAQLAASNSCDIIILYVRPIDMGLHSGGLQVRLARQNMMDAGFELPGVRHLKQALEVLREGRHRRLGLAQEAGSPGCLGRSGWRQQGRIPQPEGRAWCSSSRPRPTSPTASSTSTSSAPTISSSSASHRAGGASSRAFFGAGVVQTVTTMAPCSVLVARNSFDRLGYFICTDGSSRSMQAVRRSAVLAQVTGEPITLFSVANNLAGKSLAEEAVANAKALLKAMQIDVADIRVAIGDAAEEIVESGSLYRVIVVTDEGRSRLQRLIRGSTATDVVRKARTSVLDVR